MKFSTIIIRIAFWCLPISTTAQIDSTSQSKINDGAQPVAAFEERERQLLESKEKESALSLELVRLRLEIVSIVSSVKEEKGSRSTQIEALKKKEFALNKLFIAQKEWNSIMEETMYWPKGERDKAINNWEVRQSIDEAAALNELFKNSSTPARIMVYAPQLPSFDLMKHPPKIACRVEKPHNQANGGTLGTRPHFLFSHTEKKLEQYFPKRDFISGYGSLSTGHEGFKVFNLTLLVASPKADKIFGMLQPRDFIILYLLDGAMVNLQNRFKVIGEWDAPTQSYVYRSQYLIGAREEKMLASSEVERILIKWSKAKDEYDIFELDFFINQLYCLENQ